MMRCLVRRASARRNMDENDQPKAPCADAELVGLAEGHQAWYVSEITDVVAFVRANGQIIVAELEDFHRREATDDGVVDVPDFMVTIYDDYVE